jgi:hypothetical protein
VAMDTPERREAFTAPLDQRRSPAQEERHVGADRGRRVCAALRVDLGAPRFERAIERGRRVRRAATEPGREVSNNKSSLSSVRPPPV